MNFLSGIFLTALVAAAGPTIIHLLNRRRRRTIYWAAMDFLREVIKRNRRILHFRDLLLLLLRTAAVILFVLAMARPYWLAGNAEAAGDVPMHAVLVIDNSLSMGYKQLDKSLLDAAKAKAGEFIESLPAGSEISVIPLCSYSQWHARNVYLAKEDALEALDRVQIVDRSAQAADGFARVREACALASDIPTKRIVFLSDMQTNTWSLSGAQRYLEGINDVQIVQLGPPERTNTWVADFKLLRGIADTDSPAVFRATIRHQGAERKHVQVALKIDGAVVGRPRHVDLVSGHTRQVDFRYKFDVAGTGAEPLFVPARLEVAPDRLPFDDQRTLIVPVVARVPVVFIDQLGSSSERPDEDLFGETHLVRRLISAGSRGRAESEGGKQLIRKVRRGIGEITREDLKEARLVVIAGVKRPTARSVSLLREYVEQGGQVFLAAGGEFDPVGWTTIGWRGGAGILPAPLKPVALGRVPQPDDTETEGFRLQKDSLVGDILPLLASGQEADDIRRSALFYKAVVADVDAGRKAVEGPERKRIEQRRRWLAEYEANEEKWAKLERDGNLTPQQAAQRESDRRRATQSGWLAWSNPRPRDFADLSVDQLVSATLPQVMGRYENGHPFIVQRDIGKGRVIMMTSGLWPTWNTLALENSVLLLDRIVRMLMMRTLPARTFEADSEIVIPLDAADQGAEFAVQTPASGEPHTQDVEALGARSYGLVVRSVWRRGVYSVWRREREGAGGGGGEASAMTFAVNGPAAESELASLGAGKIPDRIGQTEIRRLGAGDKISLSGKAYIDPGFWKVLMTMALACLFLEMLLLGVWTARSRRGVRVGPARPAAEPQAGPRLPEAGS